MSGCWGNQNALREQDIQSISWLGVGVFGAGQICLREWDIQRVGGNGAGQNGCESGISDGLRRDKGRVALRFGMIKTRYGLLKARQPYEVTVKAGRKSAGNSGFALA